MAKIQITDLLLRTIIGTNNWERKKPQDIIINITIKYDASKSSKSDNLKDTIDYKALTKKIIKEVESSKFLLLEKLTATVLGIVLKTSGVQEASVKIDKPNALRFAKSVSITLSQSKKK